MPDVKYKASVTINLTHEEAEELYEFLRTSLSHWGDDPKAWKTPMSIRDRLRVIHGEYYD